MASRREQKEQLRKEREQREATQNADQRRKRLLGYGVGGGLVAVAVVVAVGVLGGGGGGDSAASGDVLPDGGNYAEPRDDVPVAAAARAAGCEVESFPADSREHVADLDEEIEYESKPPTSGRHYQVPAEDGAYDDPPNAKELVHTLEHGRVIVWFKRNLPADQRAALKRYYDDDSYQIVLVPDTTKMKYAVAATAWNRDPQPNGTGRLLGCPRFDEENIFTALESFKDEHRSRGPEPVP